MSRTAMFRTAARVLVAGIGPGACVGGVLLGSSPVRLDSHMQAAPLVSLRSKHLQQPNKPSLSPRLIRQVASGSLAGLGAGLVVAMFSRTLVFLGGLLVASFHVASRFGLDISRLVGLNRRLVGPSSLWTKGANNPAFTSSFALTFMLAAFVHL